VIKRSIVFSLFVAALVFAAGCGATAPVKLMDMPQAAQLSKSHERPLRYNVALAPVAVKPLTKPKGMYAFSVKPDTGAMRNELAKTLKDFKVFQKLDKVDAKTEEEALQKAKENGADLLLTTDVTRYNISYDHGTRGTGAVVVWLFSPWISWLVADEVYSADVGLKITLKHTSDGSVLQEIPLSGKATCELDDIQRGLKTHEYLIGSIFTGPGSLTESNFQNAATVVGPHAMQELQLKMVNEMYKIPQPPPDKKSFAVVVGVNHTKFSLLPKLKYAEADAAAFAKMLEENGAFTEIKTLTGEEATKEGLRSAVEEFATREFTEIVDFFVYFAGPGASAEGSHFIGMTESRDMNTMLPLEDFYAIVEAVEAKNRVIVLDSGFAGAGSRGLVLSGGAFAAFSDKLVKSEAVTTISSCSANQGGHEFEDLGHGIFTFQLIEALKADAQIDINRDKAVTAEEIVTYLDWRVQRYVRDHTEAQSQKPTLACSDKLSGGVLLKLK